MPTKTTGQGIEQKALSDRKRQTAYYVIQECSVQQPLLLRRGWSFPCSHRSSCKEVRSSRAVVENTPFS